MSLLDQLVAIESSGLVYALPARPEPEYAFRHALLQEAVYTSLLRHSRRALHQAVGETLERLYAERLDELAPVLAQHFAEGGDDARALHYFTRAAEIATLKYANVEAVTKYSLALACAQRLGQATSSLLQARGRSYELAGQFESARSDFEQALVEAGTRADKHSEWQSLMDLGYLWAARDYTRAGFFLQRAHELAVGLDDPFALARSLNRLGNWHVNAGEPLAGVREHKKALAIFEARNDRAGQAETLGLLSMADFQYGDVVRAAAYGARARNLFQELGLVQGLSSSLAVRGIMGAIALDEALVPGDLSLSDGVRDCNAALGLARQIGWRSGEAFALIGLGMALTARGNYGQALVAAHAGLEVAESVAHQQWTAAAHWHLSLLYSDLFAHGEARAHAATAVELARQTRSGLWIAISEGWRASVYILDAELEQAAMMLETRQDQPAWGDEPTEARCEIAAHRVKQLARVELALARGQPERALHLCNELSAGTPHLRASGTKSVPRLSTLRGAALIALQRYAEAEVVLKEALLGAQALSAQPRQWRIQRSLAGLYAAQNRQADAKRAVETARALAAEMAANLSEADAQRLDARALGTNYIATADAFLEPASSRRVP